MPRNAKQPIGPLYEPGAYIREHARVAKKRQQKAPKFADDYDKGEPLGEGRYSQVYIAVHKETKARRAVKTAYRRGPNTKIVDLGMECPGRLARHEADILKSLDHPNVIRLYEVYEEQDAVHLVLELCEGSDVLERILVSKGRLSEQEQSFLFVQMLFATWHLHCRGVVHRDLKPEHFLFTRREEDRAPNPPKVASLKVIDFGLSHKAAASFVPLGGTPQFMAPEIINGQAPNKATADRVDMWALGVVLHAMLVGHYPSPHLSDKTQKQYFSKPAWASLSEPCLDLLGQLLRHNVDRRPSTSEALQHTWARAAAELRGSPDGTLLQSLPMALRSYSTFPGLQRLALVAVAHDLDDFDYFGLRLMFQSMLQKAGGSINKASLEKFAEEGGDEAKVAEALVKFTPLGVSGCLDTVVDWTEFLAAVASFGLGVSQSPVEGIPKIDIDDGACQRAFDLLSLGSGEVNAATLEMVFASEPLDPDAKGAGGDGGVGEAALAGGSLAQPVAYDDLVRGMFPAGTLSQQNFKSLLQGQIKPRSGGGLLSCFGCVSFSSNKSQSGASEPPTGRV